MTKKTILARIEFYNFLSHYFWIIDQMLDFCLKQLQYARLLTSGALDSIALSTETDNLISERENILQVRKEIEAYLKQVKGLSSQIQGSISYCKTKENECSITVRSIKHRS
ncbi:hypothetical protein [Microcystis aeruginosa]|uniref:Uncharacterized protein n=1 Tax=Microcystis aeruginosa NIES-2521 TaxID=2303983 RepID=A0A5A5SBH0_MICAE|nr:hypothetical protein [Microcystis aeruginosa]GCA81996.1 hypothetical protein MiTs_04018 [Microcystis aeruginosa NIES-2521]